MASIYLLTGLPLLIFGLIFGTSKWIHYASLGIPAPTGTVMIPTLSVLLSIQLLLSAIEIDLRSVPREPLPIRCKSFLAANLREFARTVFKLRVNPRLV